MKTVAIAQARMNSTRLPGKSAMLLCGKPLVWHVLSRVKQAKVDEVLLAMPEEKNQDTLAEAAHSLGIRAVSYLGDSADLIGRYTKAALDTGAKVVVRVPADNPCVDPDEINKIINLYHHTRIEDNWLFSNLDGNIAGNGYPGGLGAEVYSDSFMSWLDKNVHDPRLREHPHLWAFERQRVATLHAHHEIARPDLRFDVNTQDDFDYITKIYEALYPINSNFRIRDILKFLGEKKNEQ